MDEVKFPNLNPEVDENTKIEFYRSDMQIQQWHQLVNHSQPNPIWFRPVFATAMGYFLRALKFDSSNKAYLSWETFQNGFNNLIEMKIQIEEEISSIEPKNYKSLWEKKELKNLKEKRLKINLELEKCVIYIQGFLRAVLPAQAFKEIPPSSVRGANKLEDLGQFAQNDESVKKDVDFEDEFSD